ncbi:MAG: hypothetical protein A3E78_11590 [Alphaproteobacteria bacterium RIFCSPHIGHO2_12_FULL_63_12]|nr:MAG: hypothetical protein A3E78_11590 [Alphaproteobacteria bacterium RIFCSPHIGHO2_12_FULL_63_12]
MYSPPAFRNVDERAAFDFIAEHGFAVLTSVNEGRPFVSHLPMIADPARRVVRGHLARANPQASVLDGRLCVAAFIGPNAYVSPDWYGDAEQVPTWNYIAAHVEGAARVVAEPGVVDRILEELSDRHENRRRDLDVGKIWKMSKLPAEKLVKMRAAIVAFEIDIERIELKEKLSQNKTADDAEAVASKLATGDESARAVAAAIRAARRR